MTHALLLEPREPDSCPVVHLSDAEPTVVPDPLYTGLNEYACDILKLALLSTFFVFNDVVLAATAH